MDLANRPAFVSGHSLARQDSDRLVSIIEQHSELMTELIAKLETLPNIDKIWLEMAKNDLRKGVSALLCSIAKTTTF